jgi:hypothetical protein
MHDLTSIWLEVSHWPPDRRLALATRILQSLQQDERSAGAPSERQEALRQLIGIWKTGQPPDDRQVKQIVEQERMKKYGLGPPL